MAIGATDQQRKIGGFGGKLREACRQLPGTQ
jgi:hypothetical protein